MAGAVKGSPPHTRGKHIVNRFNRKPDRITPAYAGKTREHIYKAKRVKDHPRIRGENIATCSPEMLEVGSPPHTRGKLDYTLSR